jgi:trehalose 6-phosphate phosphatase
MIERRMPPCTDDLAYFLDVDGTLLEFAARPEEVRVDPQVRDLLERLAARTGGAVALISGRSLEDVDRLFAPLVLPVAGQHGAECRSAAGVLLCHATARESLRPAAARMGELVSEHAGLGFENKGFALALHYRRAPTLRSLVEREMRSIAAQLGNEYELQSGKFVVEIKPRGRDKGDAIAELAAQPPFEGRRPVFIGDDLTDESGFEVVNRMGGLTIKVGPGITRARWRLFDAAAVRRWLETCAGLTSQAQ